MSTSVFVGRQEELQDLELLLKKRSASLIVIQGRRRIGKSRLAEEFGKKYAFYQFLGLPPTPKTTAQSERDVFMRQLSAATQLPEVLADDWSKLFNLLAGSVKTGRVILLFDEISWMGSKDPDFLGKLKNAWDIHFKKNSELILIICGSISTWIEKNILSSTGFLGRISLTLSLSELPLKDCNRFFESIGSNVSSYEKFKLLAITGGIPRYLEEIRPNLSAEENIKRLCFSKKGALFKEFDNIFSDLFSKRSETYKKIVESLANGALEYNDICEHMDIPKGGRLSEYLEDLLKSGFISRDYTWHLKTGAESRLSHFRLSDNYVRFYLKYIKPNRGKIEHGHFENRSLMSLPGLESILGLQFENLVLNNRKKIWTKLHIYPEEIISDNPFFQRSTARTSGCQIDYLIHTRFNTLYLCEIKFSKNQIRSEILDEMKQKIKHLKLPTGFSCRPVLIHVNGVQDQVLESEFFAEIINFSDFLI
ncbi:MAG: ATP-binding protein [Deltaproteobacteria bacterium]|nr:ATP-binding protein [Deltaproteobacteria bacterium]